MRATDQNYPNANGNDLLTSLETEIEELENIMAPEPITKLAVNHNETFLCDETL